MEDSAGAGAAWPPVPIWEWSSVLGALHAMPGHQLADHWLAPASARPGARWQLNNTDDGPHMGSFICSCCRKLS